jgi:hypothetical protein
MTRRFAFHEERETPMKNQDVQIASDLENNTAVADGFEIEVVEITEEDAGASTVFWRCSSTTTTTC